MSELGGGAEPVVRRLVLLRHAKSDWPAGVEDLDRPLAEGGIRDAAAAGRTLAELPHLDAVLLSPARRTRQTWELAEQVLPQHFVPTTRVIPDLYGAEADQVLDVVRAVPPAVRTVLVVGHEPTMSRTANLLAGPGSAVIDLVRLQAKYPTSGIAVFRLLGDWRDLTRGGAVLEQFAVPRG